MDERAKTALEEERKTTALARECGNLKTELEAVSAVLPLSRQTKRFLCHLPHRKPLGYSSLLVVAGCFVISWLLSP